MLELDYFTRVDLSAYFAILRRDAIWIITREASSAVSIVSILKYKTCVR
jgi:hypothetical protein